MRFLTENYEDLKRYFQGSYMKFPGIGDEVVYVQRVTPEGMSGSQLDNTDTNGWTFTFGTDRAYVDVEFLLPRKSYFEYNGSPCLLSRIPSRQYKRGICSDNVSIVALLPHGFETMSISLEVVNAYANKPLFKGFTNDTSETYVVAPRIAVQVGGAVFIDKICVGRIDSSSNILLCQRELFFPELQRAFQTRRSPDMQLVSRKSLQKGK